MKISYIIARLLLLTYLTLCGNAMDRLYKPGNLTLGGMFSVHSSTPDMDCEHGLESVTLGFIESMIFAIEEINNRTDFLKELTLGYLVEDTCDNRIGATTAAFRLATQQTPVVLNTSMNNKGKNIAKQLV